MHFHTSRAAGRQYLLFFCFLRSRGGSFRALMIKEAAEGTTEMAACRFWMVRQTVIFRPFQSEVALAMSSPIFLGDYKFQVSTNQEVNKTNIFLPDRGDRSWEPGKRWHQLRRQRNASRL